MHLHHIFGHLVALAAMERKRKRNEPQVDRTYGQRSFLPDISAIDHDDDDVSMDAIAYLRDVR